MGKDIVAPHPGARGRRAPARRARRERECPQALKNQASSQPLLLITIPDCYHVMPRWGKTGEGSNFKVP